MFKQVSFLVLFFDSHQLGKQQGFYERCVQLSLNAEKRYTKYYTYSIYDV